MLILPISSDLELRQIQQVEVPVFFALVKKERQFLKQYLPWPDGIDSVAQASVYLEHVNLLLKKKLGCLLGIYRQQQFIGMCGFNIIHPKPKIAELGYWLAEQEQHKGIMRACVQRMLEYGFNERQLNKIELSCALHNKRSQSIAHGFGFQLEGTRRSAEVLDGQYLDHLKFGLLKTEFLQGQKT